MKQSNETWGGPLKIRWRLLLYEEPHSFSLRAELPLLHHGGCLSDVSLHVRVGWVDDKFTGAYGTFIEVSEVGARDQALSADRGTRPCCALDQTEAVVAHLSAARTFLLLSTANLLVWGPCQCESESNWARIE